MKMRTNLKLYLVIFFILYPNLLWAEFVPVETARQVAVNHMNKNIHARALERRQKESPGAEVEHQVAVKITEGQITGTFTAKKNDIFVYYMFNFSPEGWAIISADDAAYPVIAYSESGFYDPNVSSQPPALTAWMDNVAVEIADAVIGGLAGLPDVVEAWKQLSAAPSDFVSDLGDLATAQSVPPLTQSTWGQGGANVCLPSTSSNSYDKYCPWEYTDWTHTCKDYCPTGCTATAMAQIMRYWQWPLFGQGSHGYDPYYDCSEECEGFDWREVDFSQRRYDWSDSSMPLNTASDAIAVLMSDIGVAVEMGYEPTGSGGWPGDAFQTYFRYNASPLEWKVNYSAPNWISKLNSELDAGRPIYYVGYSSEGSSGHAFVCDGYDSSGNFHFNWGWDGSYDGYFTLDDLTPGGANFSYDNGAIFGIEPDRRLEVYVDDDYSAGGGNDGHTWHDDAFNNIQDAMDVVHPGGTVYVGAGTYNEAIDFRGKALRLYGIGGPEVTTINGTGHYHVVQCISGEDANTILGGFTITGGNANGLSWPDNCGGGMFNRNTSSPTVTDCIFTGNNAELSGGGMYNHGCNPALSKCTFTNNSAVSNGGGIENYASSPTMSNCTFSGNTATNSGGGMFNFENSNPLVSECTFSGNTAGWGGGMCNNQSSPDVSNCTFSNNNSVGGDGGGGMMNFHSTATLVNCVFFDNSAANVGGGILNVYGSLTVINCTFSGNSAVTDGGGIFNDWDSYPSLTNCILWADKPNEIVNNHNSNPTVTYSDVEGGWPDANNTNIDADPCFANPGNGDYHLKSEAGRWDPNIQTWIKDAVSSPCIDAGNPSSDWTGEYWPHGERINMGFYGCTAEASASLSKAGNGADLNLDGGADYRDMKLLIEKWLYEAMLLPEDVSRDGIINSADFAIFAHHLELSAHHPNPSDGKEYVGINDDLSWTAGRDATSHDVYFGTSSPPPFMQNQAGTTYDPGTMDYNTVYYWRIDEVNKWGKTTGPVWSFKTTTPGPG
ncbi:MAG: C10 family peptidase [Planctomycetota bacterium]|jgi:parallel beta-helix repeat protein